MSKLNFIKAVHTGIWLFFNIVLGYMAYAVVANQIGFLLWIGVALVVMEGMVLILFKGICPLTLIARKYSDSTKSNFDIFLPAWLARYNKIIYTIIFLIILSLLIYRLATNENK